MMKGQSRLIVAIGGLLLFSALMCIVPSDHSSLRRLSGARQIQTAHTSTNESDDHVCLNLDNYAVAHDKNIALVERYQHVMNELGNDLENDDPPLEPPKVLQEGKFAFWQPHQGGEHRFSAWSDVDGAVVEGVSYYASPYEGTYEPDISLENASRVNLHGDHFAMALEFRYAVHYGHFKHDVFPILAYYKSILPKTTKFILPNAPMMRSTIEMIDPKFAQEQVYWLSGNEVVAITGGTLTVNVQKYAVTNKFHDLWNPLRTWMKATMPPVPKQRTVIYYKRDRTASTLGRLLDEQLEQDLLHHVQEAMIKYNRPEKLVVFDGKNAEGRKMTPEEQMDIFHSAQTIIGPHGTGIGGNLLWVDPAPKNCESRVNVLEFITSDQNAVVHHPWVSHYRVYKGLPLDYHVVLYASNSTKETTYIDLDMVDEFLNAIWADPALTYI